jgi:hypothetical protein
LRLRAAAGYLALAFALTARLWTNPGRLEVAGNPHDADQFAWWLTWTLRCLETGSNPFVSHAMNAPPGINVMWNTGIVLPATVVSPVTLLAGAQVAAVLLLTLSFATAAWAAWWLLDRYVSAGWPAVLGGAVYGFSPAMAHAAIGHLDLVCTPLPPLIAGAALDLLTGRGRASTAGVRLGVLAAGQVLITEELLYDTALALVLVAVVLGLSRPRAALRRVGPVAGGLLAAVGSAAVLVGYPLYVQFAGPLTQHGSPFTVSYFTADLTGLVVPSARTLVHTGGSAALAAGYRGGPPEYLSYLGGPLLLTVLVAAVVWWRQLTIRTAALLTAALVLLSLGARLYVDNHDTGVPLPWALLAHLPLGGDILPARFGLLAPLPAAAVLAAVLEALRRRTRSRRKATVAAAAVALVAAGPLVPALIPTSEVPATPPAVAAAMARIGSGATVLFVPVPSGTETVPLRWQVGSGLRFRIVGGYFIGPAPGGQAYVDGPGPGPLARLILGVESTGRVLRPSPAGRDLLRADLHRLGVTDLVLGPAPHQRAVRRELVLLFGRADRAVGAVALWAHPRLVDR